jgi:flagellar basal-body rod protein FlgB
MIQLDGVFGLYQKALSIREEKLNLISSNIANQDTPGFKARDIDFKQVIRSVDSSSTSYAQLPLKQSAKGGLSGFGTQEAYPIKYRVPSSTSLDGNTVGESTEKVAFMNNVVRYNSTLAFIEAKKAAFMQVIKGE